MLLTEIVAKAGELPDVVEVETQLENEQMVTSRVCARPNGWWERVETPTNDRAYRRNGRHMHTV